MMESLIVENAKVMPKGQITLPKDIRERLRLSTGDRVTMVCDGDQVIMMNAAIYAMKVLQHGMDGEWQKAGLVSDADIMEAVREVRSEIEGL